MTFTEYLINPKFAIKKGSVEIKPQDIEGLTLSVEGDSIISLRIEGKLQTFLLPKDSNTGILLKSSFQPFWEVGKESIFRYCPEQVSPRELTITINQGNLPKDREHVIFKTDYSEVRIGVFLEDYSNSHISVKNVLVDETGGLFKLTNKIKWVAISDLKF